MKPTHSSLCLETPEEMPTKRPKLLFLARFFSPMNSIASVRTWNIAKYLARLGWDVTIVTPHPSIWRYVGSPEETNAQVEKEGIRRILTGHRWCCLEPNHLNCWNHGLGWFAGGVCRTIARCLGIPKEIGWVKVAEKSCAALKTKDVDVILATGPPFLAFRLAKRLSDRLGCPYVLDYRDLWTGNPHATRTARPAAIQEEVRLLAGCAAVTVVSPSMSLAMDRHFGLGPKLHVVTNGYDMEELADVEPYDFGHFAIVYTGNFYPPKRVISPVMAALQRLEETMNRQSDVWYFHYYGDNENHVRKEAERFGVQHRVVLHGKVPRAEALSAVRGAGIDVVITSVADEETLAEKGIMTGKVFEAIGLGTPVLLVAPSGSDARTVVEATGVSGGFSGNEIDAMAAFLRKAVSGQLPAPKRPETYAWPNIVTKLDTVLQHVVEPAIDDEPQATLR